ncbi:MAG: Bax inhibitor-1 family protein [Longimonas sp.]|uniref:Bax inhibitor-1/YccA family protein n=1 Tax=Longimonas sp. TaxID=2039626 RepID=UPI0033560035
MSTSHRTEYPDWAASSAVAAADTETRATFIMRTYLHLASAVVGLIAILYGLFSLGLAEPIARAMLSVSWLIPMGGFILISWLASRAAHQAQDLGTQYLALAGFVVAQALILVPLLFMAQSVAPGTIESAASVTLIGFAGLTFIAFYTRKDFSFLRSLLIWGGVGALVLIVGGSLFGFQLGTFFAVGMVVFAGAAILYDTSNVLHHYPKDRYVSASLELFASLGLLFWYVLSLFMSGD